MADVEAGIRNVPPKGIRGQMLDGNMIGQNVNQATLHIGTQNFNLLAHSIATILKGIVLAAPVAFIVMIAVLWIGPKARIETSTSQLPRFSDLQHEMWRTVEPYQTRQLYEDELQAQFATPAKDSGLLHAVAISGPAGSGKTQLAFNYIANHQSLYKTQVYLDAETESSLSAGLQATASRFSLDKEDALHAFKDFLRSKTRRDDTWLVVLDNANNLSLPLRQYVPRGPRGTVIVLSTDKKAFELLSHSAPRMYVGDFERLESITLLQTFAGDAADYDSEATLAVSEQIIEDLSNFPLAIAMAGARIREHVVNGHGAERAMSSFRNDFQRHAESLAQSPTHAKLSGYQKTMWSIWDSTIELIDQTFPQSNSSSFATFLGFLDSGSIPLPWFRLAAAGLPAIDFSRIHVMPDWLNFILSSDSAGQWDTYSFNEAVRPLLRYGLLQESQRGAENAIKQHGLVRWRLSHDPLAFQWEAWCRSFLIGVSLGLQKDVGSILSSHASMPMLPLEHDMDGMARFSGYALQRYYCDIHNAGIFLADYTFDARRLPSILNEIGGTESIVGAMFTIECVSQRLVLNYFEDAFFTEFAALTLCKNDPPSCDSLIQTDAGQKKIFRLRDFLRGYITLIGLVRASMNPEAHEFYRTDGAFKGRPPLSFIVRKAAIHSIHLAAERQYAAAREQALEAMPSASRVNPAYPLRLVEVLAHVELVDARQRAERIPWATQAKVALLRAVLLHTEVFQIDPAHLVQWMTRPKGKFVADMTAHAMGLSSMSVFLCWESLNARYLLVDLAIATWSMVASLLEQVLLYLAVLLQRHGNVALAREMRVLASRLGLGVGRFGLPVGVACNINTVGMPPKDDSADTSYSDIYVSAETAGSSCCKIRRFDMMRLGACPASLERYAEHECDVR